MKTVTLKGARSGTTICLLGTTLVLLLFSFALFGQGNFGRILGRVTDPTGAVLPGATINILDTQRGLARTVTTDEAGQYNAPALNPGKYTVRVATKPITEVSEPPAYLGTLVAFIGQRKDRVVVSLCQRIAMAAVFTRTFDIRGDDARSATAPGRPLPVVHAGPARAASLMRPACFGADRRCEATAGARSWHNPLGRRP